jgi:hypothetical protein
MAVLSKGKTFADLEHITTAKVHELVDLATFDDPVDGTSLALESSTGKLKVKDDGISAAKIATDAVTPDAIDQDGGEYLMDDITAVTAKLTPHTETVNGAVTIDLDNGNFQILTIDADVTSVAALSNQEAGKQFTIVIKADGAFGIESGEWDTNWKWFGGDAPGTTATDGAVDILSGVTDGTNAYVTLLKGFA